MDIMRRQLLTEEFSMTIPQIRWDETPTPIRISLEPGDARLSPWGDHDTVIIRKIGDKRFDALVPTWSVAEDRTNPEFRTWRLNLHWRC